MESLDRLYHCPASDSPMASHHTHQKLSNRILLVAAMALLHLLHPLQPPSTSQLPAPLSSLFLQQAKFIHFLLRSVTPPLLCSGVLSLPSSHA